MMKILPFKLLFLSGILLLNLTLQAQISIVASDFTSRLDIGDTITTFLDTTTAQINVGMPGQNTWDFSGLDADEFFTSESKPVGSSPYAANFPTAQYASNHSGTFAGAFSNTWVYNSVTDTTMISHGTGTYANASGSEITTLITFEPDWIHYTLPIFYGNKHNYSGTQTIKTTIPVPIVGEITNTISQSYTTRQHVDGYGVFTLPGGKKYEGLRILEYTIFENNGTITEQLAIRILAKTGEGVHITPSNFSDSTGVVAIDEISWTTGDGTGELANRPEPPSNLIATAKTNKIDLMWTDNSNNETGFYIERSTNGGAFVRIDSTSAGISSYSDVNVSPGDVYVYRTFAYNNSGVSTSTLTASASIVVTIAGPGNLTANITQTSIGISWVDNANNETGFYIERSGSGTKSTNNEFVVIDSVGANVISYTDVHVESGIDYSYRVRAYNQNTVSDYSNTITVKIEITVDAPLNLTATVNNNQIDLSWTDNSDNEEKFYIERATDGENFILLDSTVSDMSTYSDSNVSAGVEYSYKVRASVNGVHSDFSNLASARIIPTSNFEISNQSEFNLMQNYPNPFNNITTISFKISEHGKVELTVFDVQGKRIQQVLNALLEKGEHSVKFNADNLRDGIYYYQLKTSFGSKTKQMRLAK